MDEWELVYHAMNRGARAHVQFREWPQISVVEEMREQVIRMAKQSGWRALEIKNGVGRVIRYELRAPDPVAGQVPGQERLL